MIAPKLWLWTIPDDMCTVVPVSGPSWFAMTRRDRIMRFSLSDRTCAMIAPKLWLWTIPDDICTVVPVSEPSWFAMTRRRTDMRMLPLNRQSTARVVFIVKQQLKLVII